MELIQKLLGKRKGEIKRQRDAKIKAKRNKALAIRNIKRDIKVRKEDMKTKENFTYRMRPSEKKIDKQILKNQKKNLFRVRMGGTAQDIFDIDMPRPDVPKPFSSKTALWKLIGGKGK